MKNWFLRLLSNKTLDTEILNAEQTATQGLSSEELQTLLYFLEVTRNHLVDLDELPADEIRQAFDQQIKKAISASMNQRFEGSELRQFFRNFRVDETSCFLKTLNVYRDLTWSMLDQLTHEITGDGDDFKKISSSIHHLKEAVESDSVNEIKKQSKAFIQEYKSISVLRKQREIARNHTLSKQLQILKDELGKARQEMLTDSLTKVYNRKAFDAYLERYANFSQLSGSKTTLMMLDIDHFKKVNDTFGHPTGDFLLTEFGKILLKAFPRKTDFVARYGGEEFAVILADTDHVIAEKLAEKLLNTIRQSAFIDQDRELRFTISIGIAIRNEGEQPAQWITRADQALYQAKHSGRNRQIFAQNAVDKSIPVKPKKAS